jgi:NOL1/NOP2/fmu family ribosome biogenesis protein
MNPKILNKNQTQEILDKLNTQFGIKEIPGLIFTLGGERLFLFTGTFTEKQIKQLGNLAPIERLGVYFAKEERDEIRLSIEGTQIFKDQITKNIFELTESQVEEWMMGRELNLKPEQKGFVVMKYQDNFLGCGKASAEKIGNFIPKNRRLKERG